MLMKIISLFPKLLKNQIPILFYLFIYLHVINVKTNYVNQVTTYTKLKVHNAIND